MSYKAFLSTHFICSWVKKQLGYCELLQSIKLNNTLKQLQVPQFSFRELTCFSSLEESFLIFTFGETENINSGIFHLIFFVPFFCLMIIIEWIGCSNSEVCSPCYHGNTLSESHSPFLMAISPLLREGGEGEEWRKMTTWKKIILKAVLVT